MGRSPHDPGGDDPLVDEFLDLLEEAMAAPEADFGDLSPQQVERMVFRPFTSEDVVVFAEVLPSEPDAPIATLLEHLLTALAEAPLKATTRGNLPRAYAIDAEQHFFDRHGDNAIDAIRSGVRGEQDFRALHVARQVARHAGLLRLYRREFRLTKKGARLLERHGMAGVYPEALRAFALYVPWSSLDLYPDAWMIQQSFAYSLYGLARLGDRSRRDVVYCERFYRAFPEVEGEFDIPRYQGDDVHDRYWPDACYRVRFLQRFAHFFGLVDLHRTGSGRGFASFERTVEVRPLLHDVVAFPLGAVGRKA